jgi:protease IV
MSRLARFLRRIALGIFVVALVVALFRWLDSASGAGWLSRDLVAVVWVEGEIYESDEIVETLDDLAENEAVDAVVLRVDSPGGAVAPSQEIYDAVGRVREKKPVVASLGNIAASGGYYVAAACDAIVANAGTLTGSIGVLMELPNVEELMRKLGVSGQILKAGQHKDIGSPIRPMTPEEREIMQGLLSNVHDQFVAAVAKGRRMEVGAIRPIADGRVFTGEQAQKLGLVDKLGGLQDAVAMAGERAGIVGKPTRIEYREDEDSWVWQMVGRALGSLPRSLTGLQLLYLGPRSTG